MHTVFSYFKFTFLMRVSLKKQKANFSPVCDDSDTMDFHIFKLCTRMYYYYSLPKPNPHTNTSQCINNYIK